MGGSLNGYFLSSHLCSISGLAEIILVIFKTLYVLGVLGQEGHGACVQGRGQLAGVSSLSTIRHGKHFYPVSQFSGPNLQHSYLNERSLASRINH